MLRNYLTLTYRNLAKNSVYAIIIVSGLALAYTACLVIYLFLREESSYDRQSSDSERIYRVVKNFVNDDGTIIPDATTPAAMAPLITKDVSQVESAVRFYPAWGAKFLVKNGDKAFYEPRLWLADSNVLKFFSLRVIAGDADKALVDPQSVVITESIAKKYFGNESALGKTLEVDNYGNKLKVVSAVIADLPSNMHFHFDIVLPIYVPKDPDQVWDLYNYYTYIKLKEGVSISDVEPQVVEVFKKYRPGRPHQYYTQALTDIHLRSKLKWELETNGDETFIVIFTTVGVFILLIAAVNYINLSIVQTLTRSKEVGVRKVSGAQGRDLVKQFLLESILISFLALITSVLVVQAIVPFINAVFDHHLSSLFELPASNLLIIILAAGVVALLSGLYPSMYLAAFKPAQVLKGVFQPTNRNLWLRKALVVLQFSISIGLISGAIIVFRQVGYLQSKELGFDKEQVIVLQNVQDVQNKNALKEELRQVDGVLAVGSSSGVLGSQNYTTNLTAKGNEFKSQINFTTVDHGYLDVMGIELIAGRNFVQGTDFSTGPNPKIILNEKAVNDLGISGDPVGTLVTENPSADTVSYREVIGVVKDFHFASLRTEIMPYAFYLFEDGAFNIVVKTKATDVDKVLSGLQEIWSNRAEGKPMEYFFLDDHLAHLYAAEENFKLIFLLFTITSIYIACSGLFAISSFFIKRRTKEIGIRKALGASVSQVTWLVSSAFLRIVILANLVAWPVAYWLMDDWLSNFAYRIEAGWGTFLVAGAAALVIAVLTIGGQSIRAAKANPVNSLRSE